MEWYAYRHVNGDLHVRRMPADDSAQESLLDDLRTNENVDAWAIVYADNRAKAEEIAKIKLPATAA